MTHLSDLTLELLLAQEPVPPGTEFHLHACDECWARWEALHRHEGRALPVRRTAAAANRPTGRDRRSANHSPNQMAAMITISAKPI